VGNGMLNVHATQAAGIAATLGASCPLAAAALSRPSQVRGGVAIVFVGWITRIISIRDDPVGYFVHNRRRRGDQLTRGCRPRWRWRCWKGMVQYSQLMDSLGRVRVTFCS
jgi:hypothetical protein